MATGKYKREKIPVICIECGKPFKSLSLQAKYCDKCKLKIKRMKHREYSRKIREEKRLNRGLKCQSCGADISKMKYSKKFCSDCKEKSYSDRRKKYYLKNRKAIGEYQRNYYQIPNNKEKHREIAKMSARRKSKK